MRTCAPSSRPWLAAASAAAFTYEAALYQPHVLNRHFFSTISSVRRFLARPSSVSFEAIGLSAP